MCSEKRLCSGEDYVNFFSTARVRQFHAKLHPHGFKFHKTALKEKCKELYNPIGVGETNFLFPNVHSVQRVYKMNKFVPEVCYFTVK